MLEQLHIYVSTKGNDENLGTKDRPYATIARAQAEARKAAGVKTTVHIHGGVYYLLEALQFGAEDSRGELDTVSYKAAEGEDVVVSGSVKLELSWEEYKRGIMKAKAPSNLKMDQLYIDGRLYHMARYPNFSKETRIMNGYAADCISPERASRWANPKAGYVHAMHSHLWGDYRYLITGKDEENQLTLHGGWQNNRQMGMHDEFRYVENIFEELDAPGEWYHDESTDTLYVYPFPETELQECIVEASHLPHLIEIIGSEDSPVSHIHFQGITFAQTARTFMDNKEPLLRSDWTIYRGGSIMMRGTENCTIQQCKFRQLGGNAVFVDGYNRHVFVKQCLIEHIGSNGIAFVGWPDSVRSPLFNYEERQKLEEIDRTPGPKSNNYPAACLVEDCLITKIGCVEKQSAGVQISMALDITIRHCSIYDVPRAGINISEGTFGGHLIEYCDVFDTVLETGDHGSFNSWGRDRYWLLEDVDMDNIRMEEHDELSNLPTLDMVRPVVIRNNRWRCDYGWDIDLDDGSSQYEIYNNLCLAGGIKLREGFNRVCENNVMVNNSLHPHVWFKGSQDIVRGNIVFTAYAPIRVEQPWGQECDRNLLHENGFEGVKAAEELQQLSGADTHSIIADALFVDPAAGDYRVRENSPALTVGFRNFAMDQFGVRTPELQKIARTPKLPQVGDVASESGREHQYASWDQCKVKNIVGLGEVSAAGLPSETGVLIESIPWGSWQNEFGFQIADVILEINGRIIDNVDDLQLLYEVVERGSDLSVTVFRDQKRVIIQGTK